MIDAKLIEEIEAWLTTRNRLARQRSTTLIDQDEWLRALIDAYYAQEAQLERVVRENVAAEARIAELEAELAARQMRDDVIGKLGTRIHP